MNPRCNGCGADADACVCYPAYSGNGTARAQVLDVHPTAYAQAYTGGLWAVLAPLGACAERIAESEDEEHAWELAADAVNEATAPDAQVVEGGEG